MSEGNALFKGGASPFAFQWKQEQGRAGLGGVQVAVIGLEDLRTNKRATGRLQGLADLEHLQAADGSWPGDQHAQDH